MYDWAKQQILDEIEEFGGFSDDYRDHPDYQRAMEPKSVWAHLPKQVWKYIVAPLEFTDKFLIVFTAALSIVNQARPGVGQTMNSIYWQVPVIVFGVFAVWRLVSAPIKAWRELEAEKRRLREPPPLTLKRLAQELVMFEDTVDAMARGLMDEEVPMIVNRILDPLEKRISRLAGC